MELSKVQEMLVASMKLRGCDIDLVIVVGLMLRKSEDAMIDLGIWIADMGNPTPSEILQKALDICDNLPLELQPDQPE